MKHTIIAALVMGSIFAVTIPAHANYTSTADYTVLGVHLAVEYTPPLGIQSGSIRLVDDYGDTLQVPTDQQISQALVESLVSSHPSNFPTATTSAPKPSVQTVPTNTNVTGVHRDYSGIGPNNGQYVRESKRDYNLDETLAEVGQRTVTNEDNITNNTLTINDNSQAIQTNQTAIAANSQRVSGIDTRVGKVEGDVSGLTSTVNHNAQVGNDNAAIITQHAGLINNHTEQLADHEQRITQNTNDIQQVRSDAEEAYGEVVDAHNELVGQVDDTIQAVNDNTAAVAHNEQRVSKVEKHQAEQDKTIDHNHKKAMAGVSSAMAMAGLHYNNNTPNSLALGAGNYGGSSAMAIGYQYEIGVVRVSIQNSIDQQHNVGTAASMSIGW